MKPLSEKLRSLQQWFDDTNWLEGLADEAAELEILCDGYKRLFEAEVAHSKKLAAFIKEKTK